MERHERQLFVNGAWVAPASGRYLEDVDPATGQVFAEAADAGPEDVERAVAAAAASMAERRWLGMDPLERSRVLHRIAEGIRQRQEDLAALISQENGMPITFAQWLEIPMAADVFDYFAGLVAQVRGHTLPFSLPGPQGDYLVLTLKEPVGVAGLITPWNFPLLMPSWKVAPALAAGCSGILKPAPETPLAALALAEITAEAGVPEGVLSVLTGGDEAGAALVAHPAVEKIAFTGETATGSRILTAAAPQIKRVTLELGGKSPNIVFDDVDLDEAVSGALFGLYLNAGQVCQAGSRILVQESVYDTFVERLRERVEGLRVGPGPDPTTDVGPVVSGRQLERVLGYVEAGRAEGARLVTGGRRLEALGPGFFLEPAVFAGVAPGMRIAQEEIFGPVSAVLPFKDEEEAVAVANQTLYGLAAGVWTRDVKRALRVVRGVKAGTVWLNTYQVLSPTAPFGGYKRSGLGRDLGPDALEPYLETKTVVVDLNDQALSFF
ncbi:aldehyde dehydrogenase family protein [Limnochorda pilosa]|uniref:Betaine-aldehyde dehydrogenase n=1 Tax=Limnochorda pilosa TaxID=1555112 RepID=A0A0K2SM38_LIMPI|nr:aldehyde dehydrogenase family protein [Limnochorda pilosa]BAS28165.1 betaine-aldehyde dehydrogenase [Limnochorda pilosa]